ncbi:MAG: copper amine oxidase N-terminal domain-containing protein [Defluviitaleaceae bacterium]|nr:copper amine oxidase N-terminal domain-containing protein [Defluviitaleaceae bacterium]
MRKESTLTLAVIILCLCVGVIGLAGCDEYAPVPKYVVANSACSSEVATHTPNPPDILEYEEEPATPSPTEPSFEVMYEIEVLRRPRDYDAPRGRFLFSDEPINPDEIDWGRGGPREHPFFPAGTIVAFMPGSGEILLMIQLESRLWCNSSGNMASSSIERFEYEVRLPEVLFGLDHDIRLMPSYYESIRVGILLTAPEVDSQEYSPLPTHLRFEIGNTLYLHNGAQKELETAPFINEETGHVMLPVITVTEALGYFSDIVHVFGYRYYVLYGYRHFAIAFNKTGDWWFHIRYIDRPQYSPDNIITVNDCLFAAVQGVALISPQHEYIRRDGNFIDVWASREDAAVWLEAQN